MLGDCNLALMFSLLLDLTQHQKCIYLSALTFVTWDCQVCLWELPLWRHSCSNRFRRTADQRAQANTKSTIEARSKSNRQSEHNIKQVQHEANLKAEGSSQQIKEVSAKYMLRYVALVDSVVAIRVTELVCSLTQEFDK